MHRIPVRDIMQTSVITILPDTLVPDAAQTMEQFQIRRLPVVDETGCLVGIVTNVDIREAEAASSTVNNYEPDADEKWLTVADIMNRDLITIDVTATVGQLAVLLMQHRIGGVPVVTPDPTYCNRVRLVGIVTETDIFRMIANAWRESEIAEPASV
jgi:CBS domain-containing protein